MSRDDGLARADIDTGLLSDPKVLTLARRLRDRLRTSGALVLYTGVLLASWRAGRRLALEETVPGWWLDPWEDLAAELVGVHLLDTEQRIPEHAWEGWYGPARDRLEHFRELGSRGGKARAQAHAQAHGIAHAQAQPGQPANQASQPSQPTGPARRRDRTGREPVQRPACRL